MVKSPIPFVHCGCHNLNLVVNDAATSLAMSENFFATLRDIFSFFSSSLNRWRDLGIEAGKGSPTLKKLCTTRWSSRIVAVRAVRDSYPQIMRLLTRFILKSNSRSERDNAKILKKNMDTFDFILFIVFWERILRCVNAVSRELQSPRIDLSVASRLLNIAFSEFKYLRESWQSVMLTASALAKSWDGSLEFQQKRGRKARCKSDVLVVDGILMDLDIFSR